MLSTHLSEAGVTHILPVGCFDGACIHQTAKEALEKGYNAGIVHCVTVNLDNLQLGDMFESSTEYLEGDKEEW